MNFVGTQNNDNFVGTDNIDSFYGQGGNDTAVGGKGDDTFVLGAGADVATGGEGKDNFQYDIFVQGPGMILSNDIADGETITDYECGEVIELKHLLLTAKDVKLEFDEKAQKTFVKIDADKNGDFETTLTLTGDKRGTLHVDATECGPISCGTEIRIEVCADPGTNDQLEGTDGRERMEGREGDDFMFGGGGRDLMFGDEGNDTLQGDLGNDKMYGGSGHDMMDGGDGSDIMSGGEGNDVLFGQRGNDILNADRGHDIVGGGSGNDSLRGGAGNDLLNGGAGDDVLNGGTGINRLTGGLGADRFVFGPNHGTAIVRDFEDDVDKLDLRSFDFGSVDDALAMAEDVLGDVVFTFAPNHVLVVENITKTELSGLDILV